ncbi:MAG: cbb3-type cytochrome oxidase assembly protein CcoS [Saprospiraceae bacterium]|nr:cbb3-type cytochrome oxidase assembly protein CcoS [Lewinella sp.]
MEIIFVLIALSLIIALGFLISFLWAVRSGQYEDDYTPSVRILFDDQPGPSGEKNGIDDQESQRTEGLPTE